MGSVLARETVDALVDVLPSELEQAFVAWLVDFTTGDGIVVASEGAVTFPAAALRALREWLARPRSVELS